MATFTLTDLREAAERKYAPVTISNGSDKFVLSSVLQLPKSRRKAVERLLNDISDNADNEGYGLDAQLDAFEQLIRLVTDNEKGDELLDLIGDNPALLLEIGTEWVNSSQAGEA